MDEDEARRARAAVEGLRLAELWREMEVLERVMYKSRNQHRRSHYLIALKQVLRDLRLLRALDLPGVLASLVRALEVPPGGRVHRSPSAAESSGGAAVLPPAAQALPRLLGAARLLGEMTPPVLRASRLMAALLSQAFFMPLALTCFACLARIHVLLLRLMEDVAAVYNATASFAAAGPSGCAQATVGERPALPDSIELQIEGPHRARLIPLHKAAPLQDPGVVPSGGAPQATTPDAPPQQGPRPAPGPPPPPPGASVLGAAASGAPPVASKEAKEKLLEDFLSPRKRRAAGGGGGGGGGRGTGGKKKRRVSKEGGAPAGGGGGGAGGGAAVDGIFELLLGKSGEEKG